VAAPLEEDLVRSRAQVEHCHFCCVEPSDMKNSEKDRATTRQRFRPDMIDFAALAVGCGQHHDFAAASGYLLQARGSRGCSKHNRVVLYPPLSTSLHEKGRPSP
jgi:hypothetical protein